VSNISATSITCHRPHISSRLPFEFFNAAHKSQPTYDYRGDNLRGYASIIAQARSGRHCGSLYECQKSDDCAEVTFNGKIRSTLEIMAQATSVIRDPGSPLERNWSVATITLTVPRYG
jgi:hypothetical protein